MKRRDFLKLIGVASVAPTVLAVMPKKELTVATAREHCKKTVLKSNTVPNYFVTNYIALEDIPKGKYGWIQVYTTARYAE